MDRAVFDRMAELDQDHWWFLARRRILASVIRRFVVPGPDARILEIGCGTGHNLPMLKQFGQVDGCEMDPVARDLAALRSGRPVVDARLPDLTAVPEQHYDLIALLDVLEHVEDDAAALKAIRSRLRPGGALLLTVPANPWMWSAHDVTHHHFRRYSKRRLGRLFAEAGFDARLHTHFNTLLFPLIAFARGAAKLLRRQESDDSLPSAPVNAALNRFFGWEASMIGRAPMPFGVSLLAVLTPSAA